MWLCVAYIRRLRDTAWSAEQDFKHQNHLLTACKQGLYSMKEAIQMAIFFCKSLLLAQKRYITCTYKELKIYPTFQNLGISIHYWLQYLQHSCLIIFNKEGRGIPYGSYSLDRGDQAKKVISGLIIQATLIHTEIILISDKEDQRG